MDALDYENLRLTLPASEKLKTLDEKRIERFREKVARQPREIEQHDLNELLIGRMRDYSSVLPLTSFTPDERRQSLREHAKRVLADEDVRQIVKDLTRRHLTVEERMGMLIRRAARTPEELIERLSATPVTTQQVKRGKRGPKTDYETALKVEKIVNRVAPDGHWRGHLEEIGEELASERIKPPKPWKRESCSWKNSPDVQRLTKAIEHHLKNAREWRAAHPTETFS